MTTRSNPIVYTKTKAIHASFCLCVCLHVVVLRPRPSMSMCLSTCSCSTTKAIHVYVSVYMQYMQLLYDQGRPFRPFHPVIQAYPDVSDDVRPVKQVVTALRYFHNEANMQTPLDPTEYNETSKTHLSVIYWSMFLVVRSPNYVLDRSYHRIFFLLSKCSRHCRVFSSLSIVHLILPMDLQTYFTFFFYVCATYEVILLDRSYHTTEA